MASQQLPQINAEPRDHLGTRYARRLRHTGRLPAVIYGHKQDPVHVSVDSLELSNLLHHNVHVVETVLDDKAEPCLIKDVQWDHLGSTIVHLDLTRVDLTETVTVSVAIELVGEAVGLKEAHAILDHPLSDIEIACLASQIPESIKADVSSLEVGQSMTVADLDLPKGVSCTLADDAVIATIRVMAAEPEAEEEAPAVEGEPQVIGKIEGEDAEAGKSDETKS